jgi:type I restriction enzyme S subunit
MTISAKNGFMLQSDRYSREMAGQSLTRYTLLFKDEFAYNRGNSITSPYGCIFPLRQPTAIIPFVYYCFSVNALLDHGFASHALKGGILNRELARCINSGIRNDGLMNISSTDFFNCNIATPPLAEQRAIAAVLGAVEKTIARTQALIDVVRKAKQTAMRELLTRGVRRAKAPLKALPARWVLGRVAENITHIPRDWELVTLATVAKLESGHTPSREKSEYWGGHIPWLSLADTDALDALEVSETSEGVTPKGIANSSARILPKDTVVFSRTATVGKATRMARPMATSQDFANWICGKKILPGYLVQVFRHMDREWQRLQEGSAHQTIYMPVFKKLQVLLPSTEEQEKISNIGEAFDRRLERERDTLAILIETRAALAQELLSGRLRLPKSIIARHHDVPAAAA